MRVVSGRWRGRRLKSPAGDHVRPTTDRVKEALFSIIGLRIRRALVLDLCCGSGGLGIEALSRGAGRVEFVDADRRSLLLAGENLATCGAERGTYEIVASDALRHLQEALPELRRSDQPWLILADPPYASGLVPDFWSALRADDPGPGFLMAVLEHGEAQRFPDEKGGPWRVRNRRYGATVLTVLERGC